MITRRSLLILAGTAGALAGAGLGRALAAAAASFPVTYTDAQWHQRLNAQQYAVLRQAATERPFTSPLLEEHRRGTFLCAGCAHPLFASNTKFDSGTGWPSFWMPLKDAVGLENDASFGMVRTAVHCASCGGHLGHVFDDGPPPTGKRYCMNGVAMTFKPLAD